MYRTPKITRSKARNLQVDVAVKSKEIIKEIDQTIDNTCSITDDLLKISPFKEGRVENTDVRGISIVQDLLNSSLMNQSNREEELRGNNSNETFSIVDDPIMVSSLN